jgi:hypothetical protein
VRRALGAVLAVLLIVGGVSASAAQAALPAIRHVFVIVLENESAATTFGASSPAPYLSKQLTAAGAYLPRYYAVGHQSNANYIAMISGQAPNVENQADCPLFADFTSTEVGAFGQNEGIGCVYPPDVPTIAGQLTAAGLTWRDYNESMGADPKRESAECGHPGIDSIDGTQSATATDQYATRHDPFVYFHSIIDDAAVCDSHVVNLDLLPRDLAAAPDTPNYVFVTPNLCHDGHDSSCAGAGPGGLGAADGFLRKWVPMITASPAFRGENGLLIITFDESDTTDADSCCGEIAGPGSPLPGIFGDGGGRVGAVLLSPCIAPGTVTHTAYNHYSMLRSVDDLFGLPHLGYAQLPGEVSFGSDVFTRACPLVRPRARLRAPARTARTRFTIRWSATDPGGSGIAGFTLEVRRGGAWRTVPGFGLTHRTSLTYHGIAGHTYRFRVRVTDNAGVRSAWATAATSATSVS